MYQARIGDAAHALRETAQNRSLTGTYVVSGLGVTPGSSGTAIQIDVDSGDGRIDDQPVSFASDTLTLDPVGAVGEYRADVVYGTRNGDIAVERGVPNPPKPTVEADIPYSEGGTPQPARRLYSPAPADGSSFSGLPLAAVVVGDTVSDSTDLAIADVVDYRQPRPLPGEHDHPELALNRRTLQLTPETDQYIKLAQISRGNANTTSIHTTLLSANKRGSSTARRLEVDVSVAGSNYDVSAYAYGSRSAAADVVLVEEPESRAGTEEDRYHLYAWCPAESDPYVIQSHTGPGTGDQFGEYQLVRALSLDDLETLGNVVWDTGGSTGGPGGETQVPMQQNRTVAVEGVTDLTDFVGDAERGRTVVRGANGPEWKQRSPRSGEWDLITTQTFQGGPFTTTSSNYEQVVSLGSGLSFPNINAGGPKFSHYSEVGAQLSGFLSTLDGSRSARARLLVSRGTTALQETEVATNVEANSVEGVNSTIEATSITNVFFLAMQSGGGVGARLTTPSVSLYGRVK